MQTKESYALSSNAFYTEQGNIETREFAYRSLKKQTIKQEDLTMQIGFKARCLFSSLDHNSFARLSAERSIPAGSLLEIRSQTLGMTCLATMHRSCGPQYFCITSRQPEMVHWPWRSVLTLFGQGTHDDKRETSLPICDGDLVGRRRKMCDRNHNRRRSGDQRRLLDPEDNTRIESSIT